MKERNQTQKGFQRRWEVLLAGLEANREELEHMEFARLHLREHLKDFSAEQSRLPQLLRALSLYRLCFGQPRQEELLASLLKHEYSAADLREIKRALIVELAPIMQVARTAVPPPIVVRLSEAGPPAPARMPPAKPDSPASPFAV